jgi:hypothetical protein
MLLLFFPCCLHGSEPGAEDLQGTKYFTFATFLTRTIAVLSSSWSSHFQIDSDPFSSIAAREIFFLIQI